MKKEILVLTLFILMINFVSAYDINLTLINSTYGRANITQTNDVYSYEINFDYTGSVESIKQANFLGSTSDATYGSTTRNSILSVYGSRLNSSGVGIDGNGNLFNVSFSGTLSLRYALVVYENETEQYVYYNNSVSAESGGTGGAGGGGGGGGGGATTTQTLNFMLDKDLIKVKIKQGETFRETLTVTNTGTKVITISTIRPELVGRFMAINQRSLTLAPGESKEIIIDIFAE